MLEASGISASDLRQAARTHRRLLTAKTTKFFAHEGVVIDKRTVDDNDAQARAVELMYDVAGVKAPRQAAGSTAGFAVAIEIDPVTGVRRIVVANRQQQALPVVVEG